MSETPSSEVLKRMPYGFYALGSHFEDDDNLMVCNWFTQASFEPQLVAVALQKTAHTYGLIDKSGVFSVNLLLKEDQEATLPFTKSRAKNPDKLKAARYSPGPETGCPILDAAAAYLECRVVDKLETGGDHDILLAKIISAGVRKVGAVSVDDPITTTEVRDQLNAHWPFLCDPERKLLHELQMADRTDPLHGEIYIPYTFILDRDRSIYKIYNGWWFVGRPTVEELRIDFRDLMSRRPDWVYDHQRAARIQHPAV